MDVASFLFDLVVFLINVINFGYFLIDRYKKK